jgi:hypothetical protein
VEQHESVTDDKKPLEQAVDLMVFAPLGFALEARRLLPSFVERGRQQVNMAKVVGQFAVQHGQNEGKRRLTKVQEQAEAILAEFGIAGTPHSSTDGEPAPAAGAKAAPTPVVRASAAQAATLPIADYDSLAASQVIPRLEGLEAADLAAVRAYELAHRGRKTILGKIAQLSGE